MMQQVNPADMSRNLGSRPPKSSALSVNQIRSSTGSHPIARRGFSDDEANKPIGWHPPTGRTAAAAFFMRASERLKTPAWQTQQGRPAMPRAAPPRRHRSQPPSSKLNYGSSSSSSSRVPRSVRKMSDFARILSENPPPIPHSLLRNLGKSETGVGKAKVMLRLSNPSTNGMNEAPQSHPHLSVDQRKKQVVLIDPSATSSGTPIDYRVGVAAPKMFAFDTIFTEDDPLSEVSNSALSDVVASVIHGNDGCVVSFGHSGLRKTAVMTGNPSSPRGTNPQGNLGVFPCAVAWLYASVAEQRQKSGARFSVRMSAVEIAGQDEQLRDLLAPFASDAEGSPGIFLCDDPVLGTQLVNQSEIRASTVEQAGFLLDAALASRSQTSPSPHLLITLHLYQYAVTPNGMRHPSRAAVSGGRSRLHLLDLSGGADKNGKVGVTPSAVGNVLVSIFNGTKHLPQKESKVTQVLKECLSSLTCQVSVIASVSVAAKDYNDTLTLTQLASRIHRMRRRKIRMGGSSLCSSGEERGLTRVGAEGSSASSDPDPSSSEQSCDTVIYLGPALDDATDGEHPPVRIPNLNDPGFKCPLARLREEVERPGLKARTEVRYGSPGPVEMSAASRRFGFESRAPTCVSLPSSPLRWQQQQRPAAQGFHPVPQSASYSPATPLRVPAPHRSHSPAVTQHQHHHQHQHQQQLQQQQQQHQHQQGRTTFIQPPRRYFPNPPVPVYQEHPVTTAASLRGSEEQWVDGPKFSKNVVAEARRVKAIHENSARVAQHEAAGGGGGGGSSGRDPQCRQVLAQLPNHFQPQPQPSQRQHPPLHQPHNQPLPNKASSQPSFNQTAQTSRALQNAGYGYMDAHKMSMIERWVEVQTAHLSDERLFVQVDSNHNPGPTDDRTPGARSMPPVQLQPSQQKTPLQQCPQSSRCRQQLKRTRDSPPRDFLQPSAEISPLSPCAKGVPISRDSADAVQHHRSNSIYPIEGNRNDEMLESISVRPNGLMEGFDEPPSVADKGCDLPSPAALEGDDDRKENVETIEVPVRDDAVVMTDSTAQVTEEDIAACMGFLVENPLPESDQESGTGTDHPLRILSQENITIVSTLASDRWSLSSCDDQGPDDDERFSWTVEELSNSWGKEYFSRRFGPANPASCDNNPAVGLGPDGEANNVRRQSAGMNIGDLLFESLDVADMKRDRAAEAGNNEKPDGDQRRRFCPVFGDLRKPDGASNPNLSRWPAESSRADNLSRIYEEIGQTTVAYREEIQENEASSPKSIEDVEPSSLPGADGDDEDEDDADAEAEEKKPGARQQEKLKSAADHIVASAAKPPKGSPKLLERLNKRLSRSGDDRIDRSSASMNESPAGHQKPTFPFCAGKNSPSLHGESSGYESFVRDSEFSECSSSSSSRGSDPDDSANSPPGRQQQTLPSETNNNESTNMAAVANNNNGRLKIGRSNVGCFRSSKKFEHAKGKAQKGCNTAGMNEELRRQEAKESTADIKEETIPTTGEDHSNDAQKREPATAAPAGNPAGRKPPKPRFMLTSFGGNNSNKEPNNQKNANTPPKTEPVSQWMWPFNFPGKKHTVV